MLFWKSIQFATLPRKSGQFTHVGKVLGNRTLVEVLLGRVSFGANLSWTTHKHFWLALQSNKHFLMTIAVTTVINFAIARNTA